MCQSARREAAGCVLRRAGLQAQSCAGEPGREALQLLHRQPDRRGLQRRAEKKENKKINLLFAHKANHFQAFNLLMKVFFGQHLHHQLVKSSHSKCVKISTNSKNLWAGLVYGDGEFLGNLPVSTSLGTEKLLVLVPKI